MVGKQELEETMGDGDMRKGRAKKKNLVRGTAHLQERSSAGISIWAATSF